MEAYGMVRRKPWCRPGGAGLGWSCGEGPTAEGRALYSGRRAGRALYTRTRKGHSRWELQELMLNIK